MTTYTWKRGRFGHLVTTAVDALVNVELFQFAPGDGLTIRRMIIDYGIDLVATTKSGSINIAAPLTLGVVATTNTSSTPRPPGDGPRTNPTADWNWWQGCWFSETYGFAAGSVNGAVSASGRIDREVNLTPSDTLWSTFYASLEIEDGSEDWDEYAMICWAQFLCAPTVG